MASILSALGSGSGIDSKQMVTDLVANSREAVDKMLANRKAQLDAKISAIGQVRSGLDAFSKSLTNISKSGQTRPQAYSSDTSSVIATSLAGAQNNISSRVQVRQIATAQTLSVASWDSRETLLGASLTVRFGRLGSDRTFQGAFEEVSIDLSRSDGSVESIVENINAARSGLRAQLVDTGQGKTLLISGDTGESEAFTITPMGVSDQSHLRSLQYDGNSASAHVLKNATNAELMVDGLTIQRPSNVIEDAVPGLRLTLLKEQNTNATATVGAQYNSDNLKNLVENFVSAFNELSGLIREYTAAGSDGTAAGALAGDRRLRQVQTQLSALSSKKMSAGENISQLAQIGISTSRNGLMQINSDQLQSALDKAPDQVAALFEGATVLNNQGLGLLSATSSYPSGSYAISAIAATAARLEGLDAPNAFVTSLDINSSNNRFQISIDYQQPVTIVVREASYVSGDDFVDALNSAMAAALGARAPLAQWTGNHIILTSGIVGAGSNIMMSGLETSVATRLGLVSPRLIAGTNASGMIDGKPATSIRDRLVGASGSHLAGLVVIVKKDTPSAMLHIFSGLTGELAQIAMGLSGNNDNVYTAEKKQIENQQKQIDKRSQNLKEQLTLQFSNMDKQVSQIRDTQNYLKQQISLWTANNN